MLNNVSPTTTSILCISEVKNDVCVLFAHWRALRVTVKELFILVFYSIKRLVPFLNNGIQSRKAATGMFTMAPSCSPEVLTGALRHQKPGQCHGDFLRT